MRCSQALTLLQLYIDNRLTLPQIRSLEIHLAECTSCQREMTFLEEVSKSLHNIHFVTEPADLTGNIMQRVALSSAERAQKNEEHKFSLWRSTLWEMIAVVALATIATLGFILQQPALRAILPFANGHDTLSLFAMNAIHELMNIGMNTLPLVLWVGGTILGICITFMVAGSEMRTYWFNAVRERLPAH
ncbi:MAG: zf-HC2 domain-containing protein [Chloroflexota bacterium]|nr:zf-HC2 domain-containing protein [Chloroflexota bacterium]